MKRPAPQICILVPCYNEEELLLDSADKLALLLGDMISESLIKATSYICFVNDGSTDATWELICTCMRKSQMFRGINLSKNFGHQSALIAGLNTAKADAYVSIDADLQDDERKIIEMVELYREGKEIVYGCRNNRDSDTMFKRATAEAFYKIRSYLGCSTIRNHADFRLMSARAVVALKEYKEVNLYLRGIIPMLGFPSSRVYYARRKREQGVSKYPFSKMLKLAWDGIVNFSDKPLKACLFVAIGSLILCIALIIWAFGLWWQGQTIPGWASLLVVVCFFNCFQFIFLGIIGLYISKALCEIKHRPTYIIQDNYSNGRG